MNMTSSEVVQRIVKNTDVFHSVARWAIYALFFLIPLFFLPWTSSLLEINKQILFVILTVVALVAWLGTMVLGKRLTFRSGWLNLVPALFLVGILVSSLFSVAGYQTWVGQNTQEYTSFLSVAMFVFLFYLLKNTVSGTKVQQNILFIFLLSAALSGLVTLLGMFNLVHLPFSFAESVGFNTIGTINGFVEFLMIAMFVGIAMWLVSQKGTDRLIPSSGYGKFLRVLIVFISLVTLVTLIAIDFWVFWVICLVGVLLLAVFAFLQTHEFPKPKRFAFPLVVLLISIVFLFFSTPLRLNLPVIVSPSYGTSWNITLDTLSTGVDQLLLGSGPGTFMHDYLLHKPVEVNGSTFWSLRFDRAKSYALTLLATTGIIGGLLWVVLMGWVAAKTLGRLLFERNHAEWKMTYVFFVGWFILLLSHLLYSSNFTLQFLLWGFAGLLASQFAVKTWETDFGRSPRLGLILTSSFVIIGIGLLATLFISVQRYSADVAFAQAVIADQEGGDISLVIEKMNKAVSYNGLSDVYQRNLSSALLIKAQRTIATVEGEMTTEQTQEILGYVKASIEAAQKATQLESYNVSNWSMLGSVYRDVMSFASGAEDLAANSFLNAIRLEPNNPVHYTNLGRVYLTVSERAKSLKTAENAELAATATEQEVTLLASAEEAFNKAIELKGDYAVAHYYLAATYERQGKMNDAATRMIALYNYRPTDIGVGFQLGLLLLRMEEYDAAQQVLENIVGLSPNYSNALWYLSALYELQGDRDAAIATIERVSELNPGNSLVEARLNTLNTGGAVEEIPQPVEEGEEGATDVSQGEIVEEVE
ncbi:MAG: putative O-linked GlcNAc transferase [Candidatus Uhrbacteria bacterium GW2011_GWE2_40_58]|nr:MAG: putative O-linked GlcNAc transferase [Candidatus Uhrbacteria bacterium GW2011_GWF2_40_263]KKR67484.1 MAG: putative O-linked GlcNAc transferase [Candidatus Uhrbacteria bacterium GW2011_GWE2_40_58]OGL94215.1 MAG: hypothetical protein A2239_03735 [Candidatus Uhrbacteria bacterium RIFOXYA2_FULL_40_9]OGL98064.1 MAG: hypothetical protein A2332_01640 [Candidatus Uhrbacteria bacterium RIFOXYB2_FULL_41_18]HBK35190.1 hypothetical protein [Candidatus Uhrbacteria bacterium]